MKKSQWKGSLVRSKRLMMTLEGIIFPRFTYFQVENLYAPCDDNEGGLFLNACTADGRPLEYDNFGQTKTLKRGKLGSPIMNVSPSDVEIIKVGG